MRLAVNNPGSGSYTGQIDDGFIANITACTAFNHNGSCAHPPNVECRFTGDNVSTFPCTQYTNRVVTAE